MTIDEEAFDVMMVRACVQPELVDIARKFISDYEQAKKPVMDEPEAYTKAREEMLDGWNENESSPAATALVQKLVDALRNAHCELNAIRARDGAPQHIDWIGGRPLQTSSCTHEWFNTVVEKADEALTDATAWLEQQELNKPNNRRAT